MSHPPALIIHGHFYQPPRDNPWSGIVDREPSAAPFHDWNERINRECYRPNGWARIYDDGGEVVSIVNNYAYLSFNFGPTLLGWLAANDPRTLQRIVEADQLSCRTHGHGNAIAQGYNHAILPLCNDRDTRTLVRWGQAEFRHRFGRDAAALWLPETACDDRVLGVLIDEGLKFALLAPGQASRVKIDGTWRDVSDGSIDTCRPYKYLHRDGSGRSIALFFYSGAISRAIAFEGALSSSHVLVDRFERASGGDGTLVHAVTDGESYGHHFKFGDRCLAHGLTVEAERRGFWVTNYEALLERHPPDIEVEVGGGDDGKGTSWSCAHGVGRWYRDCGCHTGGKAGWNQAWRTPLRAALDGLRDRAAAIYERRMGDLAADPWGVRDAYIELVLARQTDRSAFFERELGRRLDDAEQLEALRLLEMQRSAMLMYTSCGWFFNDLSGIETVQILRYAGRLLDQLEAVDEHGAEEPLLAQLAEATSNRGGNGADLYRREVLPARIDQTRLAAHISLAGLRRELDGEGELAGYRYQLAEHTKKTHGRITLATTHLTLEHLATTERSAFASCALHFGGVDLHCVLKRYPGAEAFAVATRRIWQAVGRGSLLTLLRIAEEELGPQDYGLEAVLPSARAGIGRALFDDLRERYGVQYEAMYQDARQVIAQFHDAGLPLPQELISAAQLALAYRFDEELSGAPAAGFDPSDYQRAVDIAREAQRHGCELRRASACHHFEALLAQLMDGVCGGSADDGDDPLSEALSLLDTAEQLQLSLDREPAQEKLFAGLAAGACEIPRVEELMSALGISRRVLAQARRTAGSSADDPS